MKLLPGALNYSVTLGALKGDPKRGRGQRGGTRGGRAKRCVGLRVQNPSKMQLGVVALRDHLRRGRAKRRVRLQVQIPPRCSCIGMVALGDGTRGRESKEVCWPPNANPSKMQLARRISSA
eukprot:1157990-Pelagomonas_calceolata.AAC.7